MPPTLDPARRPPALRDPSALEDLGVPGNLDGTVFMWRGAGTPSLSHRHVELEMNLIRRGTGSYLVGETRIRLGPGVILWLSQGYDHILVDRSEDFAMWVAVFRPSLVRRAPSVAPAGDRASASFSRRLTPGGEVERSLDVLLNEVAVSLADPPAANAGLAFLLMRAWAVSVTETAEAHLENVHPAVERAVITIRDQPEISGLDELASSCGLSPNRLSRLFKQQLGFSILAYRDRTRVERFLELYGDGSRRSVVQAAELAGFGSYAGFLRTFRSVVGTSPKRWVTGRPAVPPAAPDPRLGPARLGRHRA